MIKMSEYAKRRKELMQQIGVNGIVIIPSAKEILRNGDAPYPFRQSSDFYYLTGFEEPEAILVLLPKRKEGEYILFNRVRDREHEIWDGPRAGQEGAVKDFLADTAFPVNEFSDKLPMLLNGRDTIYYTLGVNQCFDNIILQTVQEMRKKIRTGLQAPHIFRDTAPLIHEMRKLKSKAEIAVMQKATNITAKAHIRAMQICRPGLYEYQLNAEMTHEFQRNGSHSPAYSSIIGSGRNTCILHYINNNKLIEDGDLVLVDAGCEYQNYASDITRTFPANGKFTQEQRQVYELVLKSQLAAIKAVKPGASWDAPQQVIVKIITQGLIDLGILKGKLADLIEKKAYFPFYMHRSGHWLGLDVHDAGCYQQKNKWISLEPGMVLTIEPGIYISEDLPGVAKRWHNIGVRIEDDVVVTENGCEVLSAAIPKTVAEIETLMAK